MVFFGLTTSNFLRLLKSLEGFPNYQKSDVSTIYSLFSVKSKQDSCHVTGVKNQKSHAFLHCRISWVFILQELIFGHREEEHFMHKQGAKVTPKTKKIEKKFHAVLLIYFILLRALPLSPLSYLVQT